jgi:hypothetical protein
LNFRRNIEDRDSRVPDVEQPDTNVEEVSSKLRGGLETCRSVIANYRDLLIESQSTVGPQQPPRPSPDMEASA